MSGTTKYRIGFRVVDPIPGEGAGLDDTVWLTAEEERAVANKLHAMMADGVITDPILTPVDGARSTFVSTMTCLERTDQLEKVRRANGGKLTGLLIAAVEVGIRASMAVTKKHRARRVRA